LNKEELIKADKKKEKMKDIYRSAGQKEAKRLKTA